MSFRSIETLDKSITSLKVIEVEKQKDGKQEELCVLKMLTENPNYLLTAGQLNWKLGATNATCA